MFTYNGGNAVKGGFYWNRATWGLQMVDGKGGLLPGGEETRYARVPTLLMLAIAPVMGAAFVLFLPFVGFALLARLLAAATVRKFRKGAAPAAQAEGHGHIRKAA